MPDAKITMKTYTPTVGESVLVSYDKVTGEIGSAAVFFGKATSLSAIQGGKRTLGVFPRPGVGSTPVMDAAIVDGYSVKNGTLAKN